MRNIILILPFFLGFAFMYYGGNTPTTTEVIVLRDVTDTHVAKPVREDITPLFKLDDNKWNGAVFRFTDLSDVNLNRSSEAKIKEENQWFSNEYEREESVRHFYAEIDSILSGAEKESIGKKHTAVYIPLAEELNRLAESDARRKVALVYSDLMENQKEMSFYDKKKILLLQDEPDEVKSFLEKEEQLGKLSGIEIYFLYQPQDVESDKAYRIVSSFYKKLLEEKGAKVKVMANFIE